MAIKHYFYILCAVMLLLIIYLNGSSVFVYADVETKIEDNIEKQLNEFDFSNINDIFNNFGNEEKKLFEESSFIEKVKLVINGDLKLNYSSLLSYIIDLLLKFTLNYIPIFSLLVAIAVVCSLINQFSVSTGNKSISNLVYFICFSVMVVVIFSSISSLLNLTTSIVDSIKTQIEVIFPILLTLIASLGATITVSTFQPLIVILSTSIIKLFSSILIPIFIFSFVFNVVGNLTSNIKLEKFSKFFSSLFKWIIAIVFTLFISILSIQGLLAGASDTLSIKTAKFALKSYVPILGSYLSDGISLIITSSILIKNAVGVSGLIVLFLTIFSPVLKMIIFALGLKLVASVIEPLCDNKMSDFVYGTAKCLAMPIVSIIGVAFMYFMLISFLIGSANIY